jgi:hypothetical protein
MALQPPPAEGVLYSWADKERFFDCSVQRDEKPFKNIYFGYNAAMAKKNDKSDLLEFAFFTLVVIAGFFALIQYGFSLIDKKNFNIIDAKISGYEDYIKRQWKAAEIEGSKTYDSGWKF